LNATVEILIDGVRALVLLFLLIGALFSLLGSIGIIRFPDVYSRLHAATKSATFGVISIMLGTFLYFLVVQNHFNGQLLLTILFVFLTAPLVGHMVSQAAYRSGVNLWEGSIQDDLRTAVEESQPAENERKEPQSEHGDNDSNDHLKKQRSDTAE
jgi:multicomponent Na+:H+ antiporter subunit G